MPLFWISLAFIAGVFLSDILSLSAWVWFSLLAIGLTASCLELRFSNRQKHILLSRPLFGIPFTLIIASLALGGWRFQRCLPVFTENHLGWYASDFYSTIEGIVISFPEKSSSSTVAIVETEKITIANKSRAVEGKMEIRLPAGFHLSYGDSLSLEGQLEPIPNSDGKPNHSYLVRRGITHRMFFPKIRTKALGEGNPFLFMLYRIREQAQRIIYDQMPFPESALLSGILLGIDWGIPNYLIEAYRVSGVLHIIAISGFNIAIVSTLITRLTRRLFPPIGAAAAAISAIVIYTFLVGADAAVVRAAIMGSLAIPAYYIGRRIIAIHSLTIVATAMLMANPFLLWDTSFQLSFLACLGLITIVDPVQEWMQTRFANNQSLQAGQRLLPLTNLALTTLAAQFSVLPVILRLNAQISVFMVPANLILLPLQPIIMGLGGLAVIFGMLFAPIGQMFGYAVWPFLAFCNRVAVNFGIQPGTVTTVPSGSYWIIVVLVIACIIFFSIKQIQGIGKSSFSQEM